MGKLVAIDADTSREGASRPRDDDDKLCCRGGNAAGGVAAVTTVEDVECDDDCIERIEIRAFPSRPHRSRTASTISRELGAITPIESPGDHDPQIGVPLTSRVRERMRRSPLEPSLVR